MSKDCGGNCNILCGGPHCDEPEGGILVIELTPEDLADTEYVPREEPVDVLTDGNAIMTPYGICSPGFDSHNPPWAGGRTDF